MTPPFLEFKNIGKRFFNVSVLDNIDLTVETGETLGLVGENGAGKSTLMNLLGGNHPPDTGTMKFDGAPYKPENPSDASRAGIAFIHQELNLFANLTIAENLFLTRFPMAGGFFISRRKLSREGAALLKQVGLTLSPHTPVERLSPGERQLVEIAKAIGSKSRLIIFDEPTTSLTERECDQFFQLIKRLQGEGVTMIYISHMLSEILNLCERIAVLRDGKLVAHDTTGAFSTASLIRSMVGRDLETYFPPHATEPGEETALDVSDLTQPGVLSAISFKLQRGEILGVSGLMGSGRTELARILFGLDPCRGGTIRMLGRDVTRLPARERIRLGMALLTEDRREEGLMLEAPIDENMDLVMLPEVVSPILKRLDRRSIEKRLSEVREKVRLQSSVSLKQTVKTLSGGNQQKAVLAKWLLVDPTVLILDEPTRGIDVGAKYEIYLLIQQLAAAGRSVLMISSEIEELMGLCHRILVIRKGEITDCLSREAFDQERILRASLSDSIISQ